MSSFNKDKFSNEKILRNARKEFERLLTERAKEPEWQQFFTIHPYVLSLSLPLRLEPQDIMPLACPGKTEPDFIFYPRKIAQPPFYGVIEIKRPDSKIVTITRSNVAILSRDAETAIEQAKSYSRTVRSTVMKRDNILFLGNESYIFVIMGMTSELTSKLANSFFQDMIQSKLPRNLQILPYDYLFKRFEQEIPPKLHVLVPTFNDKDDEPTDINENLLKSIDELELSVRSYISLKNAKIRTIAELVQKTEQEMIKTKNFGRKSLNEIKEILSAMGLHFNMKIESKD
jgi:hypothetical protein